MISIWNDYPMGVLSSIGIAGGMTWPVLVMGVWFIGPIVIMGGLAVFGGKVLGTLIQKFFQLTKHPL